MCAPPYACRSVTVTRGTEARPKARSSDAPWRRTPAASCARAGQEARRVGQDDERDAEAVAQVHEPRALLGRGGVEAAAEVLGLVGDHADRATLDAAEADDEVARPARRELQQRAAVQHPRGDLADVVDATVALGQHVAGILAGRVGRRHQRHAVPPTRSGRKVSNSRTSSAAWTSSRATRCETPLAPCTLVPPSSAAEMTSRVTRSMIFGPVRNITASAVMTTKSPSAGE